MLRLNTELLERMVQVQHDKHTAEHTLLEIHRLAELESTVGPRQKQVVEEMRVKALHQSNELERIEREILQLLRKPNNRPVKYLNSDPIVDILMEDAAIDDNISVTSNEPNYDFSVTGKSRRTITQSITQSSSPVTVPTSAAASAFDRPGAPPPSSLFEIGVLRSMAPTPIVANTPNVNTNANDLTPLTEEIPVASNAVPEENTDSNNIDTSRLNEMERIMQETAAFMDDLPADGEEGAALDLNQLLMNDNATQEDVINTQEDVNNEDNTANNE